jgi:hypothetical protein
MNISWRCHRIALAGAMQKGFLRIAARMVEAGCLAKGLTMGTAAEAEKWANGPWGVVRQLRLTRDSLAALESRGNSLVRPSLSFVPESLCGYCLKPLVRATHSAGNSFAAINRHACAIRCWPLPDVLKKTFRLWQISCKWWRTTSILRTYRMGPRTTVPG